MNILQFMKDIKNKLINLFKEGYCTPQIARIAKKLKEASTTIHYNIKKLERDGIIKGYKAVFDYKKADLSYCTFMLIRLGKENYGNAEEVCKKLAKNPNIESVYVITGEYEILVKLRLKDGDEYYNFAQSIIKKYGIVKTMSLTSLKEFKSEFIEI